jgi:hypothetical protein
VEYFLAQKDSCSTSAAVVEALTVKRRLKFRDDLLQDICRIK